MATVKKDINWSLRAPQDLIAAAKLKAQQEDRPLAQVVRELLRAWLADQPQKGAAI